MDQDSENHTAPLEGLCGNVLGLYTRSPGGEENQVALRELIVWYKTTILEQLMGAEEGSAARERISDGVKIVAGQ